MNHKLIFIIAPILAAGIIHHFIVIRFNLMSAFAKPVDFGKSINNRKIFGNAKTFRGFVIVTSLTSFFSFILAKFIEIDLKINPLLAGALIGLSYSLAELPNSFLKRRLNISESTYPQNYLKYIFFILDHADSIIGIAIILPLVINLEFKIIILLIIIGSSLHFLIDKLLRIYSYKKAIIQ